MLQCDSLLRGYSGATLSITGFYQMKCKTDKSIFMNLEIKTSHALNHHEQGLKWSKINLCIKSR